MLLEFKIKNGPLIKFDATMHVYRGFEYVMESGKSDYYDVSFFLTDRKDIIMTAGRTHSLNSFFSGAGGYAVPFITIITPELLEKFNFTSVLGVKFKNDEKGFITKVSKFLEHQLEPHFMIQPFTSENGIRNLYKLEPLFEMMTKLEVSSEVKEKLTSCVDYLHNLNTTSYSGYSA